MSTPETLDDAILDGDEYYEIVEVPTCKCGRVVSSEELLRYGWMCEACHAWLRVPCMEWVSERLRKRYGRRP